MGVHVFLKIYFSFRTLITSGDTKMHPEYISEHLKIKNFLGEHAPNPPRFGSQATHHMSSDINNNINYFPPQVENSLCTALTSYSL